jgi:hypothetical protein
MRDDRLSRSAAAGEHGAIGNSITRAFDTQASIGLTANSAIERRFPEERP